MRYLIIGLGSLCWSLSSAATVVSDGDHFDLGNSSSAESIRVVDNGTGGAAIAWQSNHTNITVQLVDDAGAQIGDALVVEDAFTAELDGAFGKTAVAWHAFGPCGVVVLDEAGAVVYEQRFDQFACELSKQPVSWINDNQLAFAYSFVDDSVRPWRNVSVVAVTNITTNEVTEFRPEAPFSAGAPTIDADESRILVSQHVAGFEIEPVISQVFDLSGQAQDLAFAFPLASYSGTANNAAFPRLLGDSAVVLSSRCQGQRCGLPALASFDLNSHQLSTIDVVSEGLLYATPSIQFRPSSLKQAPDGSLLASWDVAADLAADASLSAHVIIDEDGDTALGQHIFQALTDRELHSDFGLDLESVTGAVVSQHRAVLAWSEMGKIQAQYFALEGQINPNQVEADLSVVSCAEDQAWVAFELSGHEHAVEIYREHIQGEWVASIPAQGTTVERLARFGERYVFVDTATGAILAEEVVQRTGDCNKDRIRVTATGNASSSGLFSANIAWDEHPHPIEIRVGSPDGPLFAASGGRTGQQNTGHWVRDGMRFFVIERPAQGETRVSDFAIARID
jgi:hypothetical protein